jgi:glyoxylate carboligase
VYTLTDFLGTIFITLVRESKSIPQIFKPKKLSPMKTFSVKVLEDSNVEKVANLLQQLALENVIEYQQIMEDEAEPATEDQIQEIIDEAELAPYYSEKEAKKILNL